MSVSPALHSPTRPRPVRGIGTAVRALLAAATVLYLLRIVASWLTYLAFFPGDDAVGGIDELRRRLDLPLMLLLVSTFLLVPTFLAAAGTSLAWIYRTRANAALLWPYLPFRYSPTFSAFGLLIPVANLWLLRPVLTDICAGSSPCGQAGRGIALARGCAAVTGGAVAVSALGQLTFAVVNASVFSGPGPAAEAVTRQVGTAGILFATLELLLAAASAGMIATVVGRVSRQQTAALFPPQGL